jgi:hypothetical protein
MTYPTREHEELLRRALRGAADSVEPADDGLERIRARLKPPRPAIAAWMMSGAEPAALRLRPILTWFRLRLALSAGGPRRRPTLSGLRPAMRGVGPAMARLGGRRSGSVSARAGWLRAAAAMAAFAVIIGSGAFAIGALQHSITQTGTTTGNSQSAGPPVSSSGGGLHSQGQKILPPVPLVGPPFRIWPMHSPQPSLASPAPTIKTSPPPSCGPSVAPSQTPTPINTPTPTPTSTPPPASPTPTPSDTGGSPSPSPSPSGSLTTTGASPAVSTMAYISYAGSAPTATSPPVTPGTRPC